MKIICLPNPFLMFWEKFPVGEPGKASSAKLAINYLLGLNLQGLAETIMFAEKMGYEKKMLSIINEGACANGITNIKANSILNNPIQLLLHSNTSLKI
jgi:3-hydroxyisobutyrate dehydrogenase-like beta-hydroxyacid dehydrogenase